MAPVQTPTVAPAGQTITVEAWLKQPRMVARALDSLVNKRYIADRIFAQGSPDQVAGGSASYKKAESIFPDRDVEAVGIRSKYPRTGFKEEQFAAFVEQYGLEAPLDYVSIRRNARDEFARSLVKMANAMVRFVDAKAMSLLLTDAGVQTTTVAAAWSASATTIIADIAKARRLISAQELGYELDTMIVSLVEEEKLLSNATILALLPRETASGQLSTGETAPLLGLRQIIATPRQTTGTVTFLSSINVGTIADETPDPREGFTTYTAPGAASSVNVRIWDDTALSQWIIRSNRSCAMWLAEPAAAVNMTGA